MDLLVSNQCSLCIFARNRCVPWYRYLLIRQPILLTDIKVNITFEGFLVLTLISFLYNNMCNSNTSRLYSQWLNSVIYWLINHCTYWRDFIQPPVWFLMTSYIMYIILRRRYVVFTTTGVKNVRKNTCFSRKKNVGNFNALFKMAESE